MCVHACGFVRRGRNLFSVFVDHHDVAVVAVGGIFDNLLNLVPAALVILSHGEGELQEERARGGQGVSGSFGGGWGGG
jgi:hypothetical protein